LRRLRHAQQLGHFLIGLAAAVGAGISMDLPRPCPTTAASPDAAILGRADLFAAPMTTLAASATRFPI